MFTHRAQWCAQASLAAILGISTVNAAWSAPAAPALNRPAVLSRQAAQSALLAITEAGTRLVAVGERGIIVISDDNGDNWRQVPVPVSVTLTAVRFADPRHGYAVGHGGTVLFTVDGGATWKSVLDGRQGAAVFAAAAEASGNAIALRDAKRLVADGPDKPLFDLLVLAPQHVIVVGAYGTAYETTDAGQHWTSIAMRLDNPRGFHLYAIRHHGDQILVGGEQGLVRLSRDGGQTYTVLKTPYNGSFFTAEFPSSKHIVLAGLRGNVLRSADSGTSWQQTSAPGAVSITASALRGDGTLVLANQAGHVLMDTNGTLAPVNAAPLPSLTGILPRKDGGFLAVSTQGIVFAPRGGQK